jgi:hypothetical protein
VARRKTNEFEDLVNALADSLVDAVESFPVAAAPFGQVPLSRNEQMERDHQMRDNPQAWAGMISERGHRETLRYAKTMERQHQRMETNNGRTIEFGAGGEHTVPAVGMDRQPAEPREP